MIDTVAKAIHNHLASQAPSDGHIRYWDTAPKPVKDFARGLAKVALEAAANPTDDMACAGDVAILERLNDHAGVLKEPTTSVMCYRTMIAEGLKEGHD